MRPRSPWARPPLGSTGLWSDSCLQAVCNPDGVTANTHKAIHSQRFFVTQALGIIGAHKRKPCQWSPAHREPGLWSGRVWIGRTSPCSCLNQTSRFRWQGGHSIKWRWGHEPEGCYQTGNRASSADCRQKTVTRKITILAFPDNTMHFHSAAFMWFPALHNLTSVRKKLLLRNPNNAPFWGRQPVADKSDIWASF